MFKGIDSQFKSPVVRNLAGLLAFDDQLDAQVCGHPLKDPGAGRFIAEGAHDPTPTPYFILKELFDQCHFDEHSHLLDVGCGRGRVLAFFEGSGLPGRCTGVELDPDLAADAKAWACQYRNLRVVQGDALALDLGKFTHFYLFNPFDINIFIAFVIQLEEQAKGPVTVIHLSDNGENWFYAQRKGWREVASGWQQRYERGGVRFDVYDYAQHYSIWEFRPEA